MKLEDQTTWKKPFVITAMGNIIETVPQNGTDFDLDELNNIVSGYIEILRIDDVPGWIMVINEEGKIHHLDTNLIASAIFKHDMIVGNVLMCPTEMVQ